MKRWILYQEHVGSGEFSRLTKKKILDSVVYRMANWEKNRDALRSMPYRRTLDLAATFWCVLGKKNGVRVCIDDGMLRDFDIRPEELDAAAWRNTAAGGFVLCPIVDFLGLKDEAAADFPPITVITNPQRMLGASAILYESCLHHLSDVAGDDLYILPSSIHELLTVPVEGSDLDFLRWLVEDVNGNSDIIDEKDILSNSVYRYCRGRGLVLAEGGKIK